MIFSVGTEIVDAYSAAAEWCNENDAHIEELESEDGVRRFRIVRNEVPSEEDILVTVIESQTSVEARLAALEDAFAELVAGGNE